MSNNTLGLVGKVLIVKAIIESLNELNDFIVNFYSLLHVVLHYRLNGFCNRNGNVET